MSATHRFIGNDEMEWNLIAKDPSGKLLMHTEGKGKRDEREIVVSASLRGKTFLGKGFFPPHPLFQKLYMISPALEARTKCFAPGNS